MAYTLRLSRMNDDGQPVGLPTLAMEVADEHVEAVAAFLDKNMGALLAMRGAYASFRGIQEMIDGVNMQRSSAIRRPAQRRGRGKR